MRDLIFGLIALVALPVVMVVALGAATGVLTGGVDAATGADSVNGYTLDALRDLPEDELVYPDSTTVVRVSRTASALALGGEVPALTGRRILATATFDEILAWHEDLFEETGWDRIAVPLKLGPESGEVSVNVWRRDNLVIRIVQRTDDRAVFEAGGGFEDLIYEITILPLFRPSD
ncbi:MAG: hypothetical protein OEO77_04220 [Acidimicrobiia bacterium]|nr:hypothetical protein [Acidimicrobiia bacterium]